MIRIVRVWNDEVEVTIDQKSKTVWSASGTYLGHHITVTGRTPSSALGLWRDAARYKGG